MFAGKMTQRCRMDELIHDGWLSKEELILPGFDLSIECVKEMQVGHPSDKQGKTGKTVDPLHSRTGRHLPQALFSPRTE